MDPDILQLVTDMSIADLSLSSVTVKGFAQRQVVGETFPVLIHAPGGSVDGIIITGLTDLALERILFFEGSEYELDSIAVVDNKNAIVNADYFRDTSAYEILSVPWDFREWQQVHKAPFMTHTQRFMQLFGTMTTQEADAWWNDLAAR